ncbi:hypothetical protein T261_07493 [Streptomyces lydicus]|nr:hypothetical protein T261_07493 [Streptomyces lydicus]
MRVQRNNNTVHRRNSLGRLANGVDGGTRTHHRSGKHRVGHCRESDGASCKRGRHGGHGKPPRGEDSSGRHRYLSWTAHRSEA